MFPHPAYFHCLCYRKCLRINYHRESSDDGMEMNTCSLIKRDIGTELNTSSLVKRDYATELNTSNLIKNSSNLSNIRMTKYKDVGRIINGNCGLHKIGIMLCDFGLISSWIFSPLLQMS